MLRCPLWFVNVRPAGHGALDRTSSPTPPPQCKHQLAAQLAKALGTLRCSLVDDLAIADLLLEPAPAG